MTLFSNNLIFKITFVLALFLNVSNIKSHPNSDVMADLVEKLSPAVVNVFTIQNDKTEPRRPQMPLDDLPPQFKDFFKNMPPGFPFGPDQNTPKNKDAPQALGSGFVIESNGYIVTNQHVISQANEIKVKFKDDTELKAKLIGSDKLTDLALLKVKRCDWKIWGQG